MSTSNIYGVIYKITSKTTGKSYHGQTVDPEGRKTKHFSGKGNCHALRNAINKYGPDDFTFDVIASATSREQLDALERDFVATSRTPLGYNIREGGSNGRMSEETKHKLSLAHKIIQNLPEVRQKNSEGVRRAMALPHIKEKHREALKGYFRDPVARANSSARMKKVHARPLDKESRQEALKASWRRLSPEEKQKRVEAAKSGYTKEVRNKIAETAKARMADPEIKERHRQAIRAAATPEARAEMSRRAKHVHARPGDAERRGDAISKALQTPETQAKLKRRRRRGETVEQWQARTSLPEGAG